MQTVEDAVSQYTDAMVSIQDKSGQTMGIIFSIYDPTDRQQLIDLITKYDVTGPSSDIRLENADFNNGTAELRQARFNTFDIERLDVKYFNAVDPKLNTDTSGEHNDEPHSELPEGFESDAGSTG